MFNTQIAEKPSTYKFGGKACTGFKLSWLQFNEKTREVRENGGIMEYTGAEADQKGQIYCAFRELLKSSGDEGFMEGSRYFVNNDVVFDFQVNRKPVRTGTVPDQDDIEGMDAGDLIPEDMAMV